MFMPLQDDGICKEDRCLLFCIGVNYLLHDMVKTDISRCMVQDFGLFRDMPAKAT